MIRYSLNLKNYRFFILFLTYSCLSKVRLQAKTCEYQKYLCPKSNSALFLFPIISRWYVKLKSPIYIYTLFITLRNFSYSFRMGIHRNRLRSKGMNLHTLLLYPGILFKGLHNGEDSIPSKQPNLRWCKLCASALQSSRCTQYRFLFCARFSLSLYLD